MSTSVMSDEELRRLLRSSPFHQHFEMDLAPDSGPDELILTLAFSAGLERIPSSGQIHGGVLASLGDIAASFLVLKATGAGGATIHYSIDYLRPAVNTAVIARARMRRLGTTVAFVDVDLTDGSGRTIAICRGAFSLSK